MIEKQSAAGLPARQSAAQRRQAWLIVSRAMKDAAAGLGWEDLVVRHRLPAEIARRTVFRKRLAARAAP